MNHTAEPHQITNDLPKSRQKADAITAPLRQRLVQIRLLLLMLLFTVASPSHAADDEIYTSFLNNRAVSGYDVVSYFNSDQKPVKGTKDFSTDYKGAQWLFSSQENLDAFKSDPEKYAPQYGGYCAYAVAIGQTAKGDPLQYHIDDGKLYLNINAKIKERWLANKPDYINKANNNWPTVLK